MGFNMQSGESEQSSGLTPAMRGVFSQMTPSEYGYVKKRAREAEADPGGLQFRSVVDQLLPMNQYGLPVGTTEGMMQFGRDLFANSSASRAVQGFHSPENLGSIFGDAVRMASPTLIPLSTQFAMQRAQMAPALRQMALGYASNPMQVIQSLLSGSSQGQSSGSGFGFSLGEAAKPVAAALGK